MNHKGVLQFWKLEERSRRLEYFYLSTDFLVS